MMETSFDFIFLRPAWLWCLLPIFFLAVLPRKRLDNSDWHRYLPAAVIERLLQGPRTGAQGTSRWWSTQCLLILMVLALAGPSFVKQAVPAVQRQDAVAIVLDLSLSMYAEDQAPNRLARAKQKVHDLLALRKDGLTGLVVFAGSAHVVAPLTDDRETLRAMMPALDPAIMPEPGANPGLALIEASNLIRQAGLESGRILLLTDSIEAENLDALLSLRADLPSGIAVSVLAFGTEAGGPISLPDQGFLKRDGEVIIARSDIEAAENFASARASDQAAEASFDDRDLRRLIPELSAVVGATTVADGEQKIEQRIDQGFWLLPLMAVLGLFLYRRGTLLAALGPVLMLLGGLLLVPAMLTLSPAVAAEEAAGAPSANEAATAPDLPSFWDRLWLRDEQLADRAYRQDDFPTAAALYEDPARKGAAQFKAGEFGAAAETLARAKADPVDLFNQGNAYAYAGELEPAIAAYEAALELDPAMKVAQENRDMIQQLLDQQQQQQQQQQQKQNKDQKQADGEQDPQQGDQGEQRSNGDASDESKPQDGNGQNGKGEQGQQRDDQQKSSPTQSADPDQSEDKRDVQGDQADRQKDAGQSADAKKPDQRAGEQPSENEAGPSASAAEQPDAAGKAADKGATGSEQDRPYDLSEQQQAQWLRRIPDDPGELLQRKFLYQYRNPESRYDQRPPGSDGGRSTPQRRSPDTASSTPW